jgi:pyruvate dehydrogenase complex dehydrogenase (E1) component
LNALARKGDLKPQIAQRAMRKMEIDPEKDSPLKV